MSWSLGLVSTGVVLRWGLGAESFAWLIVFVFLPLCCVYYPVATLPAGCSRLRWRCRPPTCSKACARSSWRAPSSAAYMLKAFGLNVVYFALGFAAFAYFLQSARVHGTLVQMGE